MRVEYIGLPFIRQLHDCIGLCLHLAPLADQRRAACRSLAAMKGESFAGFRLRADGAVARTGEPAHIQPGRQLRAHDGSGAEGVAAVQRERMIEDVKNAHGRLCLARCP